MSVQRAPTAVAPRRWPRRLLLVLVLLVVLIWILPFAVARPPCLSFLAQRLSSRLHGSLAVGSASLGWFAPVVLRDVEVRAADGRRLLSVAEIASEGSLLSLILHPQQLGTVRVRKAQFEIAFAGQQSDLEQVFAAEVQAETEAGAGADGPNVPWPQVRLELVDAGVKIVDTDRKLSWSLDSMNGALSSTPDTERTVQLKLAGNVSDGAAPGSLKIDATLQHLGEPEFRAEMKGKFVAFPLASLGVVARRFRSDTELTGYLDGQCQLSASVRDGKPQFRVAGEMVIDRCEVASPFLEERLCLDKVQLPCRLQLEGSRLRLEQAELTCDLGTASVRGELDLAAGADRPGLELTVDLDLARVAAKLPRTLRLQRDLRLSAGRLHLECRSTAQPDGIRWAGRLDVSDLHGLKGQQPVAWTDPIQVVFQAHNASKGLPVLDHLNCTSRFLRIEGATRPDGFALQFDAKLQQLMEPLAQFVDLGPARLAGAAQGRLNVRQQAGGRVLVDIDADLDEFDVRGLSAQPWHEPRVRLSGQGLYDSEGGELHFAGLHFESQYLACAAQGKVTDLEQTRELDVAGQVSFDLAKLEPLLRPYLGKDGQIVGSGARAFKLSGLLRPHTGSAGAAELHLAALTGESGMSWQKVRAHGCDVGPAELRACLQRGWLQVYPVETTLNGGRLHLQPNIRLEPGPVELLLVAGPLIEKAQLTPELCAGALGYLVPGLAGAAQTEGLISVSLDGGRLPLGAPATGEIKGTLVIHSARVSPGPMGRELAVLMRGQSEVTLPRETRVPFHFVNGRVHHRDLEFVFPELTVRSSGSVGLDGSLALVVEMPVPPRWLGSSKLSAALANKTIRIPVGGTLDQPHLDQGALQQLNAQLARELAGGAVRNELEKGLQRLFRPR